MTLLDELESCNSDLSEQIRILNAALQIYRSNGGIAENYTRGWGFFKESGLKLACNGVHIYVPWDRCFDAATIKYLSE